MFQLLIKKPFHATVSVITNCPLLVTQLKMKYGPYIFEGTQDGTSLLIKAIRTKTEYELLFNEHFCRVNSAYQEIEQILFETSKYDDHIFALHGAAIEWRDMAYLCLAPTMSGKSTLTSFLVNQGFGYLTDDCILLDRNNFLVYPFSTPIQLRNGGIEILREKYSDSMFDVQSWSDGISEHYAHLPHNIIETPVPLAKIFFIKRTDSENKVIYMDSVERLTSLLKSPITKYEICGSYLRSLVKLVEFDCSMLFYHDMDYVAHVIRDIE